MENMEVVKVHQIYADVKGLAEIFSISECTVRRLINEMKKDKKWKKGIIAYERMLRIKIADFEGFFKSKSYY